MHLWTVPVWVFLASPAHVPVLSDLLSLLHPLLSSLLSDSEHRKKLRLTGSSLPKLLFKIHMLCSLTRIYSKTNPTATLRRCWNSVVSLEQSYLHINGVRRISFTLTILQTEHLLLAPFSPQVVQNSTSTNPTCPVMAWVSTENAVGSDP